MANPRIGKLEDQIQLIVAEMLQRRVKDPRLGFVTVTDVRLTGDGREASVFYTNYGPSLDGREADAEGGLTDTAAALESTKGLLRTTVGQRLGLKFTPSLTFIPDASQESAKEMDSLLDRVRARDAELAASRGDCFAGEADPYRLDQVSSDGDDGQDRRGEAYSHRGDGQDSRDQQGTSGLTGAQRDDEDAR